jgi:hypothetical protein
MDIDPVIVACLPVLRGFEPRGIGRTLKDPACDSYMSLEVTELLAMNTRTPDG